MDAIVRAECCVITPSGIEFTRTPTEAEWLEIGSKISTVSKSLMWMVGDWLLAGELSGYIQRGKLQEACERFGIAYKTAAMAVPVCKAFESSRRLELLTFGHHSSVANREDSAELLEWAAERQASVQELSEVVRLAVLNHPRTQQFIKFDMPRCQNEQEANELFCLWLCEIQSFEAWSRCARKYRGQDGGENDSVQLPAWYNLYLTTEHWARKKFEANELYRNCVLCSRSDGKLDTHHRTYLTLGEEPIYHLSLLCDSCHRNVHDFLRIVLPYECPDAVHRILVREGLTA